MNEDSVKTCSQCIATAANGRRCKKRTCKSEKCWIHLKKEDGLRISSSTIPGVIEGLFAAKDFDRNEKIGNYKGMESTQRIGGDYVLQVSRNKFVDAKKTNSCAVRYANDCKPINRRSGDCAANNSILTVIPRTQIPILKANRPIEAGQEIFTSYGPAYWRDHSLRNKQIANDDQPEPVKGPIKQRIFARKKVIR